MHNIHVIRNTALIPFEEKIDSSKHVFSKIFSERLHIIYFSLFTCSRFDLEIIK